MKMGWFRRAINNYKLMPMTRERAVKIKGILAGIYFMTAWTGLGYTLYYFFLQGHKPTPEEAKSPSKYYTNLFNLENVKVITVKSLSDYETYTIEGTPPKKSKFPKPEDEELPKKDRDEDLELLVEETSSL